MPPRIDGIPLLKQPGLSAVTWPGLLMRPRPPLRLTAVTARDATALCRQPRRHLQGVLRCLP